MLKLCKLLMMISILLALTSLALAEAKSNAYNPRDGVVRLFGAGGPHTAIKRAADIFQKETGIKVVVTAGPQSRWTNDAKKSADIIWGTAESALTAFLDTYVEFDLKDAQPIYIRPAVIAVQKGNPKNIRGIADLLKPGLKIIVTEGGDNYNTSGTGVWEDVAGRLGSLEDVKAFRKNILVQAKGSGASFAAFKKHKADAWITWTHWPINNPNDADMVEIEPERRIYRDLTVVTNDKADPESIQFIEFLKSDKAYEIFKSEGFLR